MTPSVSSACLALSPLPLLLALAFHVALAKGERDAIEEGIDPAPLRLMRWALWPGWLAAAAALIAAGLGQSRAAVTAWMALALACGAVMLAGLVWLAIIEYAHWKRGAGRKS